MALSNVEPEKNFNNLPNNDYSLMAAVGNTLLVELQYLNPNPEGQTVGQAGRE